jgi:LacI family transcriptional regulator
MEDVAAEAVVSLKTVSRVVNGASNVDPVLAGRVTRAIARLGYRRNDVASSLRAGRSTATIALIIEDLANAFYSTIASAVAQVAREHDTLLLTSSLEENQEQEQKLVLELCQRRVDGLLIVPAGSDHSYLRAEIEMGIPAVFLDRPPIGLQADTVLIDNQGGARSAIEHLHRLGHERIGVLVDSPTIYTARQRLDGVRIAFAAAGLTLDDGLVRDGLHDPRRAAEAVAALLDGANPPGAFFCGNNRITIGALTELIRRDVRADLVGFDDFEASALMPRGFMVVTYDNRELGRRGAELLFQRIDGSRVRPVRTVLPTRLEARGIG